MKIKVLLFQQSPRDDGFHQNFLELGVLDAESIEAAYKSGKSAQIQEILAEVPSRGAPGRSIVVFGVDDEVHAQWCKGDGADLPNPLPHNFHTSNEVTQGQTFSSAQECSRHLGFNYNEVSYALKKVAAESNPKHRIAVVRGIHLMYQEDFDNANW